MPVSGDSLSALKPLAYVLTCSFPNTIFFMKEFPDLDNVGFNAINDDEQELIPLLTTEEEDQLNSEQIPETLPILPLRNTVLFPGVVIPIDRKSTRLNS